MAPLHFRVKRRDCTIFLLCESSDTIMKIKGKLAELLHTKISSVHLWGSDKERSLEDEGIVADQGLPDDSVIYLTLDAEPIAVTQYELAHK